MKNTGSCRCGDCAASSGQAARGIPGKSWRTILQEMVTQANEQLKRAAPEAGVDKLSKLPAWRVHGVYSWLSNRLPAQTYYTV